MSQIAREKLIELVRKDPSFCEDARRCGAMLRDLCRNEPKKEILALTLAIQVRVVADLRTGSLGAPMEALLGRLALRLCENCGLREDIATWTVESWAVACGMLCLDSPDIASSTTGPMAYDLDNPFAQISQDEQRREAVRLALVDGVVTESEKIALQTLRQSLGISTNAALLIFEEEKASMLSQTQPFKKPAMLAPDREESRDATTMTMATCGLRAPTALERFGDLVELLFEANEEITPRMMEKLRAKADELGVHQLDFETIFLNYFFTKPTEEFMMVRRQAILWPIFWEHPPLTLKYSLYCIDMLNEKGFAGCTTWRLPKIEELRGLMEPLLWMGVNKYYAAKLRGIGFTTVQSNIYWSGSFGPSESRRPFCLNLKFGGVSRHLEDRLHYLWPVAEISDK